MVENVSVEVFKGRLQRAVEKVKTVLHINKNPQYASDVHHAYRDKYLLAELMTRTAVASQVNCLESIGLTKDVLDQLRSWRSQRQHVSLRFTSEERCSFLREESKEVDNPTSQTTEGSWFGKTFSTTSKLVTTVKKYYWKFEVSYKLEALRGVGEGSDNRIELLARSSHSELTTKTDKCPRPDFCVAEKVDVDMSWLIDQLEADNTAKFSISRAHRLCHTPSRNPDVGAAIAHFTGFARGFAAVVSYLNVLFRDHAKYDPSYRSSDFFQPVLPLFEDSPETSNEFGSNASESLVIATVRDVDERDASSKPLGAGDLNRFLSEELRCLRERRTGLLQAGLMGDQINVTFTDTDGDVIVLKREGGCVNEYVNDKLEIQDLKEFNIDELQRTYSDRSGNGKFMPDEDLPALIQKRDLLFSSPSRFPAADGVASSSEAVLVMVLAHCADVCNQYLAAVSFIEAMIREQLIAAIGKEVTPADFEEYMLFHSRKLFNDTYAPSLFCFSIRRSGNHNPEGTVSIERSGNASIAQPIVTMSARSPQEHRMEFALSASVNVKFSGHRHLHAYLQHQFSCNDRSPRAFGNSDAPSTLSLVSRARQFSSMIVLVGRIVTNNVFEPTHAVVVQNKDELTIPLEMTTIPAAQEFKDAIESLSPEQQTFAKAFRAMQLQSTLFGVLIVQIKPQLEKVLNLHKDSLTKEIKLTQDLMQLFSTYQIPSDLLSFSEEGSVEAQATAAVRLEAVRSHAKAMFDMINLAKKEEIEQREKEIAYQEALRREREEMEMRRRMEQEMAMREKLEEVAMQKKSFKHKSMPRGMPMKARRAAPQMKCAAFAAPAPAPPPPPAPPSAPGPVPQATMPTPSEPVQNQSSSQPVQNQSEVFKGKEASQTFGEELDITSIPTLIDQRLEDLQTRGVVRPVIINVGSSWQKLSQKALLASPTSSTLGSDEQKKEKDAAFDLLDALTKSGALPLENASLHVVVAASHCFDQSLLATVTQDNVNPIDQVEQTALTMATTIYQQPLAAIVRDSQYQRLTSAPEEPIDDFEASVEGTWSAGSISGTTLTWSDGKQSTISMITPKKFTVTLGSVTLTAELKYDGKIYWSDDDVWEKKAPPGSPSRITEKRESRSPQPEVSILGDGLSVRGAVGSINSS